MSQGSLCKRKPESASDKQRFDSLLSEALALADALALPPEIGARLQEVIDLSFTAGAVGNRFN